MDMNKCSFNVCYIIVEHSNFEFLDTEVKKKKGWVHFLILTVRHCSQKGNPCA